MCSDSGQQENQEGILNLEPAVGRKTAVMVTAGDTPREQPVLKNHSYLFSFLVVCIAHILQKEDDEHVNTA